MAPFKIVVLVSDDRSDLYFANQIAKHFPLAGLFVEQQQERRPAGLRVQVKKAIKYLFLPWRILTRLSEKKILGIYQNMAHLACEETFGDEGLRLRNIPGSCRIVHTRGAKAINDAVYVHQMEQLRPDLIVVCGCSILGEHILEIPRCGVLNLHGGLSQKYRGVWTTLWAVVNSEPEFVGATVHFVSPGIDDGDIVYQGRPQIEPGDNPETLYGKVVKLGVQMMVQAIADVQGDRVLRYPLTNKGRLYPGRLVTPGIFKIALEKIEAGLIPSYLQEKESRDAKVVASMYGSYQLD